ncbi:hypothetical protein [Vibrio quintilis]|uniref:Uncharacterized protein n=1 Tax=Vibrio quintilis TaxID=1117707 RepID=A0A1M7Z1H8_9VIBR|nr:hypothetical protein [Vibrio quintilis]SHO58723.1 hypothetical protein VQ7734_04495 [Vibrio quintilis]
MTNTIKTFLKHKNLSTSQDDVNTLNHNLQIDLPADNRGPALFLFDNKILSRASILESGRTKILCRMQPPALPVNYSQLKRQKNSYRNSIKKAIKVHKLKGHLTDAQWLNDFISIPDNDMMFESAIEPQIINFTKPIKKNILKLITVHNALVGTVPRRNVTFIQYGEVRLYLYPKNGILPISSEEFLNAVRNFLTASFPHYDIKLIGTNETVVQHTNKHTMILKYYLSGKNRKTGIFDLLKEQNKVVEQAHNEHFAHNKNDNFHRQPLDMRYLAQFHKRMLDVYLDKHLFQSKGLKIG